MLDHTGIIRDVLTIIVTTGVITGGLWRYVVSPIARGLANIELAMQLEPRLQRVEREVLPNGDDALLPLAQRGAPLRSIVIQRTVAAERQFVDIDRQQLMMLQLLRDAAEDTDDPA